MNWQDEQKKVATGVSRTQQQEIETLKRCLFQMQEAAQNLVRQTKREWVDLTDKEAQKVFHSEHCNISADLAGILAKAIRAKLKEKNT
jgi:hypothetical protein